MATGPAADAVPTRREAEVLACIGEHLTNAQIAARLYISERTVESHVSSLLRKLGAPDRRALARRRLSAEPPSVDHVAVLPPALELLADEESFVGREAELEALRRQWRTARDGQTVLTVVTGEPGMGKSRLAAELAAEVHAAGGHVLLGACYEDADAPYGPFAQAILDDAVQLGAGEARLRAGDAAVALARLGPELAQLFAVAAPAGPDATARSAVLDAVERWLVASATAAPLLLVVEDVHWSTATTRDALRHLVRKAGRAPLLIVATTRDSKPDLDADLARLVAELERSPSVERVALHGLGLEEVGRLAGAAADEAGEILAETHGNPLLVTHLTTDVLGGALPLWLYRRDQLLDDEARAVLDQAATFGTEFDADLLAAAHRAPLLSVLESLEAAEAAGLVASRPGHRAGFTFVHALFRSARYRALPLRRRLELHARAAAALAGRPDDGRLLSERARHACLAVPVVEAREAIELARAAAARHEAAYAYDEAVAHYRRGRDAAVLLDPPAPEVVLDLDVRIGAALHHRGDPDGLALLLAAAHRAEEVGDARALVGAAMAIPQFGAVGFIDPMPEGRAITEAALAALGDEPSPARARLLMDLASHLLFVSVDEALALARRAEGIARSLGDPDLLGDLLLAGRHLVSHPAHLEERLRLGAELELLGRRRGRLAYTLAGMATQAYAHLERGEMVAWTAGFERFIELLGDRTLGFFQAQGVSHRANRAFIAGDLVRAEEIAELTVPWSHGIGAGRIYAEGTIVADRRLQARDGELVARYERAAARSPEVWYRCSLAAAQARSGRHDAARSTLRDLGRAGFPIRAIYPWSVAVTDLAEAAEVVGDRAAAGHVLAVAGPYSGRLAVSGPCPNRPFDQALAQAALAVGDIDAATDFATRAVAASRARQTPAFLVRELVFLAEARRRAGDPGAVVRPLVREALTTAEAIGAAVVAADVERYQLPA